jgi:hypothetical protein
MGAETIPRTPLATGRWLLGVTPVAETERLVRQQSADGVGPGDLRERDAAAAACRAHRPPEPEGAEPVPPDPAWEQHLARVAARPLLQRQFDGRRWRFASVPLSALVVPQPSVNFTYARARTAPGVAAVAACLPAEPEPLELWGGVGEAGADVPGATFYTRDMNVHVASARLEPAPRLQVTFALTKTAVFVQVLRLGGRLVLRNGTHRAVGLALRGETHLPCVLVETDDLDDLPDILPRRLLAGPRPPLVGDFLDPVCHLEFPWRDRVKFIRLVPEEFVTAVPGAEI